MYKTALVTGLYVSDGRNSQSQSADSSGLNEFLPDTQRVGQGVVVARAMQQTIGRQ